MKYGHSMNRLMLCCSLLVDFNPYPWLVLPVQLLVLSISFEVASLALGQSYDCPSASEATMKDMSKQIMLIIQEL